MNGNECDAIMIDLKNETVINVATLLQEPVGARRSYPLALDVFPLDRDLTAEEIEGGVKLTTLIDEIVAAIDARGVVTLECQRCLTPYRQPFETGFDEEFRVTVDVKSGAGIATKDDDERFTIDENHELDFAEPLRQEILVALPMRPTCGADCPGPPALEFGADDGVDDRFAALAKLLDDEPGA